MTDRVEELKKDLQELLRKHNCEICLISRRLQWSNANLIEVQFNDGDSGDDFEFEGVDEKKFWGDGNR
jgi:hypothetical protein